MWKPPVPPTAKTPDAVERRRAMAEARIKRQDAFRESFAERMAELRQLISQYPPSDALKSIAPLARGLYELGDCSSFHRAALVSQDIERLCAVGLKGFILTESTLKMRLIEECARLQTAFAEGDNLTAAVTGGMDSPRDEPKPLFVMVADADDRRDLGTQLQCYNYRVVEVTALADIDAAIEIHGQPAIIIFDIGDDEAMTEAKQVPLLRERCPTTPIMLLGGRKDFEARLYAAQMGCAGYHIKPLRMNTLVDQLVRIAHQQPAEPYRVLIVDDDRAGNIFFRAVFEEAGIEAKSVDESLAVLDAIEEFKPDVILLDLYMPTWPGVDVAAAIRQHEDYFSIPIVYLSAETVRSYQLEALRVGADDFLTKPLRPEKMVDVVNLRAQRYRDIRHLLHRETDVDGLTGMLNHGAIVRHIDHEIALANRAGSSFCIVMVDVDNFKQINDSHGHRVGDMVLRSLCNVFRQRFRSTDLVGRYGGEEFLILMPGTLSEYAAHTMDWVREAFATIEHGNSDTTFHATFCCGVAEFGAGQTTNQLIDEATRELSLAKSNGRNCVYPLPAVD